MLRTNLRCYSYEGLKITEKRSCPLAISESRAASLVYPRLAVRDHFLSVPSVPPWCICFVWLLTVGGVARPSTAQPCGESPTALTPLGSPSGCNLCLNTLLPGAMEPAAATAYYIESDLPERFCSTGVLYATIPVLPPDSNNNPPLNMRTQVASGYT